MRITAVDPDSPLFGHVRPGYRVVSINGAAILDTIDFRFKTAEDRIRIRIADNHGQETDYDFDDYFAGDLGLTLDDRKVRTCKNECIFCFIHQQPQGMRRALYIKDEDYRLSFTHGNFVTLSNTTDEDIERIIEQRLSPLYISVHATDDRLRRCMLHNERLVPIIPRLRQLTESGITVHTQVVLCPGINDGPQLERTINELSDLAPDVETLAVVPVGLTRYRDNLPNLRTYTREEAREIIAYVEQRQKELLEQHGTRFVWAADEFYIQAELDFPRRHEYEEMNQFENGIGMAREFITNFNRKRRFLSDIKSKKRALFLTGYSAYPFLTRDILPYLTDELNLKATFKPVTNKFWGEMVTVSGLLTGQDMLRFARQESEGYDALVLPPNCLNNDDLFLDNLSLEQFQNVLECQVHVGQYDMAATIREVYS